MSIATSFEGGGYSVYGALLSRHTRYPWHSGQRLNINYCKFCKPVNGYSKYVFRRFSMLSVFFERGLIQAYNVRRKRTVEESKRSINYGRHKQECSVVLWNTIRDFFSAGVQEELCQLIFRILKSTSIGPSRSASKSHWLKKDGRYCFCFSFF